MDMTSKQTSKFSCLAMIVGMFVTHLTHATSITYNLTTSSDDLLHISNTGWVTGNITDGNTYASVTIDDDSSTAGLINFTVSLSSYWDNIKDSGFGIDSFGFNVAPPEAVNGLVVTDIINISGNTNWVAVVDYTGPPGPVGSTQNGFGKFDAVVSTSGAANRVESLTFSINNAFSASDGIEDYIAESITGLNGTSLFALHIAGFTDQNPDAPVIDGLCPTTPDANIEDCNLLTSVWVADNGGVAVVPVPAAAWLFGSGLLGLAGIARRKKA